MQGRSGSKTWPGRLAILGGLVLLSACVTTPRTAPAKAFEIAEALACSQAQLDAADPGCLVLSDPRASDSRDRASVIAEALLAAGYKPVKVWAAPMRAGERVLGFTDVQNRGACFARRDCGEAFDYYLAAAVPGPDGALLVIDPAILKAPADVAAWASRLVLTGRSLADVRTGTTGPDVTVAGIGNDGSVQLASNAQFPARAGLKAAYCALPGRRQAFRGVLALRGYEHPRQPDASCPAA